MPEVLIISAEPRLVSAVKDVLEEGTGVHTTAVDRWARGQALLFKDRFDLVVLDYECLKLEALDAFITIDNILQKEKTAGILLVRQMSERASQIEDSLQALRTTIDMSQGKPSFIRELSQFRHEIDDLSSVAMDDSLELSREIDNFVNVEFELPAVSAGSLKDTSPMRLYYTCRIRKESGTLTLKSGNRSIRFGFDVGSVVLPSGGPTRSDVVSTFGWVTGDFQFDAGKAPSGSKIPTFDLLHDGMSRLTQTQMHDRLEPLMKQIPVPTNLWEDRKESLDESVALLGLMRMCDGRTKWNEVLNSMGSLANEAFKSAYFAIETDLLFTQEKSGVQGVLITYGRGVRKARQAVADAERQNTKAFRAESDDRTAFEAELFAQLSIMRDATPHENFEIWEGCGRDVVRNRFYQLVKEYHPDVYGGNVSGRVKNLAQELFILVKANYKELLKVEREQTVAPPQSHLSEATSLSEASESMAFARSEGTNPRRRPIHETPGPKDRETPSRTKSSVGASVMPSRGDSPSTNTSPASTSKPPATPEPERPKTDVKSKIEKLSGFRRREARKRNRRISTPGKGLDMGSEISASEAEEFEVEEIVEEKPPEISPEVAERQAKLEALKKKAEQARGPNSPDPAKEAFNEGYRAYREDRIDQAFLKFQEAYEKDPENGLYLTFYGYLLFRMDPTRIDEAEDLVRKALQTGNRQAMPDGCLFLGFIFKARGDDDRAYKQFQRAYRLNPASVEAEREIRLAERRKKRRTSEPGAFIKNLFKK